jgi:hypothetical protein
MNGGHFYWPELLPKFSLSEQGKITFKMLAFMQLSKWLFFEL